MASGSTLFSTALISAVQYKLLGQEKLLRMAEARTADDAVKVLYEAQYGDGATVRDALAYGELIKAEERSLHAFIRSVMPNEAACECLFSDNDYHNLKVLIKAKLTGVKPPDIFACGNLDEDTISQAVENDAYTFLPKEMREGAEKIAAMTLTGKISPSAVDVILDDSNAAARARLLKKAGCPKLGEYFALKTDMKNLITVVRCMKLGLNAAEFFVQGGSIAQGELEKLTELTADAFGEKLRYGRYGRFAETLCGILLGEKSFFAAEKAMDDCLMDVFRERKNDAFSVDPIIGYYLGKETELKNVRIIMTGIIAGADKGEIKERLRECYVQ